MIRTLRGKTALVPTMRGCWGTGLANSPRWADCGVERHGDNSHSPRSNRLRPCSKPSLTGSGLSAPVSFERLGAADIGTRARAYQSLTKGGMDATRGAEIAGF